MIGRRSVLAGATALGFAGRVAADTWPSRPIKLVAPFAPGGGSDFTSRLVAEKLSQRLGQTVLVDNKPGAGGNLGAEAAIKAPADGYTFLTISGSYAINSILHKPSFDSLKDIVAIGQFTDEPTVLCVNPSVPAKTLKELVELARRESGKLAYGSSGPGGLERDDSRSIRRPDRSRAKRGAVEGPSLNNQPQIAERRSLRYAPSALRSGRRVILLQATPL
jgi:tripartite-type tricarboxylate transporter receptor subunit TctC